MKIADRTTTSTLTARRPRADVGPASWGVVLLHGGAPGSVTPPWAPLRSTLTLGRQPPSGNVTIEQRTVSRTHARLTVHAGGIEIADLGSHNGTFVNGAKVDRADVGAGDVIRVGNALFLLVASDAEAMSRFHVDGSVDPPGRLAETRELVGGYRMDLLLAEAERIARTDLAVLVQGESGTGKELLARAVHAVSARTGKLVAVNSTAIPPALLESELFGSVRGAFTGAERDRLGLVRAAHKGTLFLDEIGDMPLEAQAKLLRVLEAQEVVPVGSVEPIAVDVRIVSATHHDLGLLVAQGRFRGDLLARLRSYVVELPPLRERKEDILPLVRRFLTEVGRGDLAMTTPAIFALLEHDWPWNVRELAAAIRRAAALAAPGPDACLDLSHLPPDVRERPARTSGPLSTRSGRARPGDDELRNLMRAHDGNLAALGRALGKDRAQIRRWLRYAGIDPNHFR